MKILKKILPILLMSFVIIILLSSAVYASTWTYRYPIYVIDTSLTNRTNVPVVLGFGGQNLVNAGKINANGLNTNMQIGTSDNDYMMSTDQVTTIIPSLPSGGKVQLELYAGYSPEQTVFPIIIGDGGTIVIPDTMNEPGNNAEWEFTNIPLSPSTASGKEDNFEWGVDGDSLATSGGGVTWTVTAAGTSKAEIDTAQKYTGYGGYGSARLYGDGTNTPIATTAFTPIDNQIITAFMRKDDTSQPYFICGNGSKRITFIIYDTEAVMYRSDAGYISASYSVAINTWYKVQFKDIKWTAGTWDLYINDALIVNDAGMYSDNVAANVLYFSNGAGTSESWLDNISVQYTETDRVLMSHYDAQAGGYKLIESPVTGGKYLARVITPTATDTAAIRPNAAGTTTQITPSAGANYACSGDNNDATSVSTASTSYLTDTYGMPDIDYVPYINSVTVYFRIRTMGTIIYGKPVWRIGSTNYAGTEASDVTGTFVTKSQTYTTSPATGLPWTYAELAAAEFGVQLKTSNVVYAAISADVWYVVNYNTYTFTDSDVSGITAGEYDITASLSGGTLGLTIGGSSDTTAFAGSIPNSTAVTTIVVPYASKITYAQGGTPRMEYSPTSMLNGTTIEDNVGTNDGTISWGTNTDLTISFGIPESYESYYSSVNATKGFNMPSASMPSTWFSAGESIANLPFYDMINQAATGAGVPAKTIYAWIIVGLAFCAFVSVIMYTRSAFMAVLAMAIVFFVGSSMTIIPMWLPFVVLITDFGIMYLVKQVSY
jgi:hypothetical protein